MSRDRPGLTGRAFRRMEGGSADGQADRPKPQARGAWRRTQASMPPRYPAGPTACLALLCAGRSVVSDSLPPHGRQPTRFLCPWDSPGKNTGAGCHFLLQRIFRTQGSNLRLLRLLRWQVDSLLLCHLGSPLLHLIVPCAVLSLENITIKGERPS